MHVCGGVCIMKVIMRVSVAIVIDKYEILFRKI